MQRNVNKFKESCSGQAEAMHTLNSHTLKMRVMEKMESRRSPFASQYKPRAVCKLPLSGLGLVGAMRPLVAEEKNQRAAILQNPEIIQSVQDVKLSHETQAFMEGQHLILCDRLEIPCTNITFELE